MAAPRVVYFGGVAQSQITRDSAGSGKIQLTCTVLLHNTSDTVSQRITELSMRVWAVVPKADAAYNNPQLLQQTGASAPPIRHYVFYGQGSNTVTGVNGSASAAAVPITISPQSTLSPYAGRQDSVLARGSASFQYKSTQTYDDGVTVPPSKQPVMLHCSGRIKVEDVGASPGALIASGSLEAVADSYENPTVKYGVTPFGSVSAYVPGFCIFPGCPREASGVSPATIDRQPTNNPANNDCTPGVNCFEWTNPAPGEQYMNTWGVVPSPDYAYAPVSDAYYGGEATATNGTYSAGTSSSCSGSNPYAAAAAASYTMFPQHLISVPFMINGGKPF